MASETIVAVFSDLSRAEAAIGDLVSAGIPSTAIKHYARDDAAESTTGESSSETHQHHGFWAWLTGQESSTDQHDVYDRSIRSGRTVVTVVSDASTADRIHEMLERHDPLDLEDHSAAAGAGASGPSVYADRPATTTSTSAMAAGTAGTTYEDTSGGAYAERPGIEPTGTAPVEDAPAGTGFAPRVASNLDDTRTSGAEQVIPLSEETIEIGKRQVDRGSTRIRRYTVERPVEEQIRLRDETVSVSRRPVTGRSEVGADAFTDREIVVNETEEQAVVGKTSRVVEEVVVQKGVNERTETVHDTVRREEIEVEGPDGRAVQNNRGPDSI